MGTAQDPIGASTDGATAMSPRAGQRAFPLLAAGFVLLLVITAHGSVAIEHEAIERYVWLAIAHGGVYAACAAAVLKWRPGARDLAFIIVAGVVLRGIAMTAPENLSTDVYRYIWDGNLQLEGVSPYAHVPADPQLERFRDFTHYDYINQKETAHTIYPPVAQMVFLAAAWLGDEIESVKLVMVAFEGLTVLALLAWLRAKRLPRERVLIYLWHPLPIWELASQAHVDAALAAFVTLAVLAATLGRQGLAGAAIAAAALVKYFPLAVVPALWRRFDWRMPAAMAATAAVLYLPYISVPHSLGGTGRQLVGNLPGHLDAEGYVEGYGFHLVWLLDTLDLPSPDGRTYVAMALSVLAGLGLVTLLKRGRDEIHPGYLLALACALVWLASPHYPWYFAWIVPMLVLAPHPAALALTVMAAALQLPRPDGGTWTLTDIYLLVYWLPALSALALLIWKMCSEKAGQPASRMIT